MKCANARSASPRAWSRVGFNSAQRWRALYSHADNSVLRVQHRHMTPTAASAVPWEVRRERTHGPFASGPPQPLPSGISKRLGTAKRNHTVATLRESIRSPLGALGVSFQGWSCGLPQAKVQTGSSCGRWNPSRGPFRQRPEQKRHQALAAKTTGDKRSARRSPP